MEEEDIFKPKEDKMSIDHPALIIIIAITGLIFLGGLEILDSEFWTLIPLLILWIVCGSTCLVCVVIFLILHHYDKKKYRIKFSTYEDFQKFDDDPFAKFDNNEDIFGDKK